MFKNFDRNICWSGLTQTPFEVFSLGIKSQRYGLIRIGFRIDVDMANPVQMFDNRNARLVADPFY